MAQGGTEGPLSPAKHGGTKPAMATPGQGPSTDRANVGGGAVAPRTGSRATAPLAPAAPVRGSPRTSAQGAPLASAVPVGAPTPVKSSVAAALESEDMGTATAIVANPSGARAAPPLIPQTAPIPVPAKAAPLPSSPDVAPNAVAPVASAGTSSPPREDVRPIVRALVDRALSPIERAVRDLERRVEELEGRPPPAPVSPEPVRPAALAGMPAVTPPVPTQAQGPYAAPRLPVGFPAPVHFAPATGPSLHLDADFQGLDGRRRRRRLLAGVVVAIALAFGGLLAALAASYTH
jgi:hypothetical protein